MSTQGLFIPFYCNNCNQLAFICKPQPQGDITVVEYDNSHWREHLCYNLKGENIWSHHQELPEIEWGNRKVPVKFPNRSKKARQNQFSVGVIIELPDAAETDSTKAFYKVLTPENSVIYLRSVDQQEIVSAGILIDLTGARKIGTDKYRVAEIVRFYPELTPEDPDQDAGSFFSFKLSAHDQEQLESFVDRFLQMLSQHNLYLESITPAKIQSESGRIVYQRKLTVSSGYRLQKAIETMTFPESIHISI